VAISTINGKKSREFDDEFVELLTEQDSAERSGQHDTLEAAIAAHKRDIGKAYGPSVEILVSTIPYPACYGHEFEQLRNQEERA
jgi:hypothetical protein